MYTEAKPGSPPHMRGKVHSDHGTTGQIGITPAHAGKRILHIHPVFPCRDHPRTCGEKSALTFWRNGRTGSPPHMRGKVDDHSILILNCGITPAHAGKSLTPRFRVPCNGDHPRTCGEKRSRGGDNLLEQGSPPHMRGKGQSSDWIDVAIGITPAHAGKRYFGCSYS